MEPATGREVWRSASDARAVVDPLGNLFQVGDRAGTRIDPGTGRRTATFSRWDRGDAVVRDNDVVGRPVNPQQVAPTPEPADAADGAFRPGRGASVAWSHELDESIDDLAMGPNVVVALSTTGVTAWESSTGEVRWSQDVWYQHLFLARGVAVLSGNQDGAVGLSSHDGTMLWAAGLGDLAGRFKASGGGGSIVADLARGGLIYLDPTSGLDAEPAPTGAPRSEEAVDLAAFTIDEEPAQVAWRPDGVTSGWTVDLPDGWVPDEWCATWEDMVAFSFRRSNWFLGEAGALLIVLRTSD